MMVNGMYDLVAAAKGFAGLFAAVLFVYYYSYIQNEKPGMAAA